MSNSNAGASLGGIAVLAAGFGSRLRPLTERIPKPLVPIGDRPMIEHVLGRLGKIAAHSGVRIGVNAHHLAPMIAEYNERTGRRFDLVAEQEILGTAGGTRGIAARLGPGALLVWNSDILVDLDLTTIVAAHASGAGEATLVVRPRERGEGNVGLLRGGKVVRLRRESFGDEDFGGEFLGIHVVGGELVRSLPERGCLVGDVYLPLLRQGAVLQAFLVDVPFVDVGTLPAYLEANLAWLREGVHASQIGGWKATSASVAHGVVLARCVVGAGARVEGVGTFRDVVVWPRAVARAPLERAIVTEFGVVPVSPTS